jgi:rhodanese-related sulfurtransferase
LRRAGRTKKLVGYFRTDTGTINQFVHLRLERDADLLILDVRGLDEFTDPLGHIRGATNMPLNELPAHLSDLVHENRPAVVVCNTDRRSSMAAQQLQEAGMSDVSVLRGAMEQWRVLGLPAS